MVHQILRSRVVTILWGILILLLIFSCILPAGAASPNGLSILALTSSTTDQGDSSIGTGSIGIDMATDIVAGETAVFSLDRTAVYQIDIKSAKDFPKLMVTAKKGAKPPGADAPEGAIYQYFQIKTYSAPAESMEMATIRFTVTPEWLEKYRTTPESVSLYRYDEESEVWVLLSTVSDGEKGTAYKLFADTAAFGYFAIVAEEGTAPREDENPATTATSIPASPTAAVTAHVTALQEESPKAGSNIQFLLAGGCLAIVAAARASKRNAKCGDRKS